MRVAEEGFYGIIQDTMNSTLGFQVERIASQEFPSSEALTVGVKITGAWDGEARLHCSAPLSQSTAAAIFQVKAEDVRSDEILDALSELIHIVGGNLMALLPQPVTLSLPCLPDQMNREQTTPQWQTVHCLTVMSRGHPFVVTLLRRFPSRQERKARQPAVTA